MGQGYVYLMQNTGDGTYKIGFTQGKVEDRRKQLLTGSSEDLAIICEFPTKHPRKLEKYLHRIFHHERHRGEFFKLEPDQVKNFVLLCEKMEKTYDFLVEQKNYFVLKSENF